MSAALEARLAVRERPAGRVVMRQRWRALLFLHWEVDAEWLGGLLPPGLEPDLHQGRCYLGVVPFFMEGVRPRGLPAVPGLSDFLELNVRSYVVGPGGVPGVWFHSLDANQRIACAVARRFFQLNYRDGAMSAREEGLIDYRARRHGERDEARYRYRVAAGGPVAEPGTLEFFLVERYVLYAHDAKRGRLRRGRVWHEPYRLGEVEVGGWSTAPLRWNGMAEPAGEPDHVCGSGGVEVEVFGMEGVGGKLKC